MSHFFYILKKAYPSVQNYELSTLNFNDDEILETLSISFIEEVNKDEILLRFYCFDTNDRRSEYIVTILCQDFILSYISLLSPNYSCLIEVECIY